MTVLPSVSAGANLALRPRTNFMESSESMPRSMNGTLIFSESSELLRLRLCITSQTIISHSVRDKEKLVAVLDVMHT